METHRKQQFSLRIAFLLFVASLLLPAEPIRFSSAEATYYHGKEEEFLKVIDGLIHGPMGWSPAPRVHEPQSLIVRCQSPMKAEEVSIELYFFCGRPLNPLAEFRLSATTDPQPSWQSNWQPLTIERFAADVHSLQRTAEGTMRIELFPPTITGNQADDVYRLKVRLPQGLATGFRLDAIPVELPGSTTKALSWWPPHDFTLTEFHAEILVPETTNIALHRPVLTSHDLYLDPWRNESMKSASLTDGIAATIAHPHDLFLGEAFYFEIDLGREVEVDHINLRNRADEKFERMRKIKLELLNKTNHQSSVAHWFAINRPDGSDPGPGAIDTIHAQDGRGKAIGRFLKISSQSDIAYSPQLAEVEVYERRTPQLVALSSDGHPIRSRSPAVIPPGARRLSIEAMIPQYGMPRGDGFRWRLRGVSDDWQNSNQLKWDMPCPAPGNYVLELQARHSDDQWDASLLQVRCQVQQHFWQDQRYQGGFFMASIISVYAISRRLIKNRSRRQIDEANARAVLAEERSRIARDLHDDLGANFAEIAIISELARESLPENHPARSPLATIYERAENNTRRLGEIVWAVNPAHDTIEHLIQYLCNFAQDYLSAANIRCRFDMPDPLPQETFTAAQRYQLLLAAKEAIHNAVRHGKPKTVEIKVEISDDWLRLIIHDDGIGFDPALARTSSRGCGNMRLRMDAIHGSLMIDSHTTTGTTVQFYAPLQK